MIRLLSAHILVEWALLLAGVVLLLVPGPHSIFGLALLILSWIARRSRMRMWSARAPAQFATIMFVLALLVSLIPSIRLDYSVPKLYGVIAGLALYYACMNSVLTERAVKWATIALISAATVVATVSLLVMDIASAKLVDRDVYDRIYSVIPHLRMEIQSSTVVSSGFEPNEVAGILALFAPLMVVLGLFGGHWRRFALPAALVVIGVLALTQSRISLIAVAVALTVGALWTRSRRSAALGFISIGLAALVSIATLAPGRVSQLASIDLPGRVDLWQQGLLMLIDAPFTGIGLNTFPLILPKFYPPVRHISGTQVPHAHNLLMQTAIDFGIVGLIAFLVLVIAAVRVGTRAATHGNHRALAIGLLLGLFAHAIFSMFDAVTLGAKPGVLIWVFIGLLVALGGLVPSTSSGTRRAGFIITPWRGAIGACLCVPLLIAPFAVNTSLIAVHRQVLTPSVVLALQRALQIAEHVAWGPYGSRISLTMSYLDDARGDASAELMDLSRATAAAPWDRSLALMYGDRRLAAGDRAGAVNVWRDAGLSQPLLNRANENKPEAGNALQWFLLAREVDPSNWQADAGAATVLVKVGQYERAAPLVADALQLAQADSTGGAVAKRLFETTTVLPENPSTPDPIYAQLYLLAARVLENRDDLDGGLYAAQLSARSRADVQDYWLEVETLGRRLQRRDIEIDAQQHLKILQGLS